MKVSPFFTAVLPLLLGWPQGLPAQPATILINEVCTDPQVDYSGGNWDGSDGGGSVTGSDEYIELYNPQDTAVDLSGWVIEYQDSQGDTQEIDTALIKNEGPEGLTMPAGSYYLLGNIRGDMNNSVWVALRDSSGRVVDQVSLGIFDDGDTADNAPDGNAPTGEEWAVGRNRFSMDTDTDRADFYFLPASPGQRNWTQTAGIVAFGSPVYQGLLTPAAVALSDIDLDTSPRPDTAVVTLSSTCDRTGYRLFLVESGAHTGVFGASFSFDLLASDSTGPSIRVSGWDTIWVRYQDAAPAGPVTGYALWKKEPATGNIVISEVLANPSQNEDDAEWVELYNNDTQAVDISGWWFISDQDTTLVPDGMVLEPGSYGLVARELVDGTDADTLSFESIWGNGSGVWGDHPAESTPAFDATMSLTNGSGTIRLDNTAGYHQEFAWDQDAGNGISWEKIDPHGGDGPANWGSSQDPTGSTPGRKNSRALLENNLGFGTEPMVLTPIGSGAYQVSAYVYNRGSNAQATLVTCRVDSARWRDSLTILPILPGASTMVTFDLPSVQDGYHTVVFTLSSDEYPADNRREDTFLFGTVIRHIIINEIMFSPVTDVEPEWIELYNRDSVANDLLGWTLGDGSVIFNIDGIIIPTGGFAIVTRDTVLFRSRYPDITCPVYQPTSWNILNNTGDVVVLRDNFGTTIELIVYDDDWMGPQKGTAGISLERIDPGKGGEEAANWWGCTDPAGATPGKVNSIHSEGITTRKIKAWADPDPFSPKHAYFRRTTQIKYTVPFKSLVTVEMYDIQGRKVKTLAREKPCLDQGEIEWDGSDDKGRKLDIGIYILFLKAEDGEGKRTKHYKNTVVIANSLN